MITRDSLAELWKAKVEDEEGGTYAMTRARDDVRWFFDAITGALQKGDEVRIHGFGNFKIQQRAARMGRNPRTGEAVKVPGSQGGPLLPLRHALGVAQGEWPPRQALRPAAAPDRRRAPREAETAGRVRRQRRAAAGGCWPSASRSWPRWWSGRGPWRRSGCWAPPRRPTSARASRRRLAVAPGPAPAIPLPATGSFDLVSTDGGQLADVAAPTVVADRLDRQGDDRPGGAQARAADRRQSGPTYTITDQDVDFYDQVVAEDGSNLPVTAGEQFSERQLLLALLLPSANNIAETLAVWVAGVAASLHRRAQRARRRPWG